MKVETTGNGRKLALLALVLSLVCLGTLIAFIAEGNYLAAFGSLMACYALAWFASKLSSGDRKA